MPMTTSHDVVPTVRAELARRHITQKRVAEHLGLSQQGVSLRMSGRVQFRIDELSQIADLLDLPVTSLLAHEKAPA